MKKTGQLLSTIHFVIQINFYNEQYWTELLTLRVCKISFQIIVDNISLEGHGSDFDSTENM